MRIDFTKDDHETLIRLDESMSNHLKHHERGVTSTRFYIGIGLIFIFNLLMQIALKYV